MPGSREVRFLKDELIAWLKSGDGEAQSADSSELVFPLDTAHTTVYHRNPKYRGCLLYTSDAADERSSVDLGGRRTIKQKKNKKKRSS